MYRASFYEIGLSLEKNLEPCCKCFIQPAFEDRCENYGYTNSIYIRCDKCQKELVADLDRTAIVGWEEKYIACKNIAKIWNAENNRRILLTPIFEPPSYNISAIQRLIR